MPRKILHLDLDAFFCAVEEKRDTSLCGKPFAVGGNPDQRGVVASCSYAARKSGVHSAMPMSRAIRLCPDLIIVHGHYVDYSQASKQVMDILHEYSPLVEQVSIDEAFLDLSDMPEALETLARNIQAEIHQKINLPCSIGGAVNKLVAKIATDAGKAAGLRNNPVAKPPNAIMVIPPGQEASFLAPLPAQALWGVGPKTAALLAEIGIQTIGDLAGWPADDLILRFGKHAAGMIRHAQGIDENPVVTQHEAKSISQEMTFAHDIQDAEVLLKTFRQLSEQVGRSLRKSGLSGRTVKLKLRWHDFTTLTRQTTLPRPSNLDEEIYQAVRVLFENLWTTPRRVRLIGVGVSHFDPNPIKQLGFWETIPPERQQLQQAMDELQERFGKKTIRRGTGN